ncbi:SMP-30/gluconolactonase/LRE family protein [Nocardia sp. ET3-3]|uniref:SMP-30/gluconolactonase/LRE family protein n=1 Tax=Nocardia terrae TaxID=2675851 RepID=A0A7K1VAH4_9NOCA|nr:SMP-30/gluconolactonase/LRE family protein [Nocardia terrae]MVU83491.1 SMP-30/gluconolactonase/LRE family protein [Nocardia terrae]
MHTLRAHLCAPPPGRLCEGPVWDPRTRQLLWVDIRAGLIHRATLTDGLTPDLKHQATLSLTPPVSAVLPCASGRLLATMGDTIVSIDGAAEEWDAGSDGPTLGPVVAVAFPTDGVYRRFNDAKVDPRGRVLAGTMVPSGAPRTAALYRLDPDGTLITLRTGVTISNGLGWSPDGRTLYYADSPTHRVDAFDYDLDTGTLGEARPFAHFEDGEPDGLTVDAEGNVWVAVWGAGQVRGFDPAGSLRTTIEVGPSQVSSCTFAGPALDVLVITTAAENEAAEEAFAGRLFTCVPGTTGLPMTPFADSRPVLADDH